MRGHLIAVAVFITAFQAFGTAQAVRTTPPHQYLEVPFAAGARNGVLSDYEVALRKTLLSGLDGYPYVRLIAGIESWAIDITRPEKGQSTVRLIVAKGDVWNNSKPRVRAAITKTVIIPANVSSLLRRAWLEMLRGVRYLDPLPYDRFDGATYTFAGDNMIGETWSPDARTYPGRLLGLGRLVKKFMEGPVPSREAALIELGNVANQLVQDLIAADLLVPIWMNPDQAVVLPDHQAKAMTAVCGRPAPGPIEDTWTPDSETIRRLELTLGRPLQRLADDAEPGIFPVPVDFYRQYAGLVVGGRRIVYVNGFYKARRPPSWQTVAVNECSGDWRFGAEFDPATNRLGSITMSKSKAQ